MIFQHTDYLVTPYRPLTGALSKNDVILAKCVAHPERFLVSPLSGEPRVVLARQLTDPNNAAWEVWRGGAFVGILLLDRIVPLIDARWQFVFFDDELASKAPLLNEFAERCFSEFGLHRLTVEAPDYMNVLIGFARRKLDFVREGVRNHAYHDGTQWRDIVVMARHRRV